MVKIMYWGLCDKCGGALIKTQKGILCENCDMEDEYEKVMKVINRKKENNEKEEVNKDNEHY